MMKHEELYNLLALRDRMFRLASTLLVRRDEAEDAVADVVARFCAEPQRLSGSRNPTAFILTSLRNRCYDLLRQREAARRRDAGLGEGPERAEAPQAERWEVREMVRHALSRLPVRQREVLHLKEIEGFATAEIAELLDTDEAQVRVLLSRARHRLREELEKWR